MKIAGTCGVLSIFCIFLTFLQSFTTVNAFKQRLLSARSPLRQKRQIYVPDFQTGLAFLNRTRPNPNPQLPESGPWGPWTQSSQCSRTCGGGVAYQERVCLDTRADGSHSCIGGSRRYFTCNTVDCPPSTKDFRTEQCARFNAVPYKRAYYSWVPYHYAQSPCELYCMPQGGNFYARLDRKVTDGTRCRDDGSLDICVEAQCMPVGCDRVLGSTAEEDECGVCGGDGSSCRFISGIFDETNLDVGYNDFLLIPVGSTSILIEEVSLSNNFLAVRNAAGEFFLNGRFQIERSKDFWLAGTLFHYARKPNEPEVLKARGPTNEPLYIVMLFQVDNPGIKYRYSVPVTTRTTDSDSYSWTTGDFEECSQTCGGGVQYRPVRCVRTSDKDIVDENLCDPVGKPSINQTCNQQPCPSGWHIGDWNDCSASCGGGSQFRLVFCRQGADASGVLPDDRCEEEKPLFMRACNTEVECPKWNIGEWGECDRTCGPGNQTRSVECSEAEGDPLDAAQCDADEKPPETQDCNLGPCEGVEWIASDWSGCEGTCSPHMQSRSVHCANEDGVLFPDDACEAARKPALTQPCPKSSMCEPMWHVSQWTECSVECGEGVQSRVVFCGVWEEDSVIKIDDDKCDMDKKFEDVQNCSSAPCQGTWFTGPWNRCSVPCGGGERSRKILCFHQEEKVEEEMCVPEERPFSTEPCNTSPCDADEMMVQGGCKDSKFGCCPDGVTPAGFNDEDCPKLNISGTNSTCEEAEFGCCADNFTLALGPFRKGCPTLTSCNTTQHGCCPDGDTPASGPDFEGCDNTTCDNTTFGCCPDMLTPATGPDMEGCGNDTNCDNTTFGCCPDMLTPATGPDMEGCGNDTNCDNSTYGCCPDMATSAKGPDMEGCDNDTLVPFPDIESSGDGETNITDCNNSTLGCCDDGVTFARDAVKSGCMDDGGSGDGEFDMPCDQSTFGCCPDNVTLAKGFEGEGCEPENCSNSTFGCCPDNTTSASGPDYQGCGPEDCSNSTFGCCPDNTTTASGPDYEGCGPEDCSNSTFGCCPDNTTSASGIDYEGCGPEDCSNSTFGCCPDNATSATGPDYEGCGPEDCSNSTFGCCPDNTTSATGPDYQGCEPEDCSNTTFGCCPDNVTTSTGPEFEGCDNATIPCSESEFGCCEDNVTAAIGDNFEGCNDTVVTSISPESTTAPPKCASSTFGCCPDEITTALGPNLEGCCFGMRFGCCPDNKTAALGPTFLGCGCQTYPYKCCPDEITPAQGFNYFGCRCEHFRFGCCQDGVTPATGPHSEGCVCQLMQFGCCPDGVTPRRSARGDGCGCDSTRFGCCPDGRTAATSADLAGCPCDTLRYGCCPDGHTPARTPDLRDCPCDAQRYGCCLDGSTPARGPNYEGCPCETTRFGCCPDGFTTAQGPDRMGCPCDTTIYGCCADGYTAAKGPKYEGCPEVLKPKVKIPTEVCSLPKESGPCRNFTVLWHFDILYGSCSRFWYGGCDGNGNKFATLEECENTCVKPEGPDACLLPRTVGSCTEKIPSWYYDVGSKVCETFTYGGCLGNNNRFVTKEACEQMCINLQPPTPVNVCALEKDEGSCNSPVIQWYYKTDHSRCEQFYYMGCKGNANRFASRIECEKSCLSNFIEVSEEKEVCRQPQKEGNCAEFRERWFYDYEMGRCHRFLYSGCGGNDNNFGSFAECEKRCSKQTQPPAELEFRTEYCFQSSDPGPCNQAEVKWYYDSSNGVCKEFYYGGCLGNENRFKTRKDCEKACFEAQDVCSLPMVKGPCSGNFIQWYFDRDQEDCLEFQFTGCQGNGNRFNSKESCYHKCKKDKLTTTPPPVTDDVCSLPQQPGPCLGYYRMWYYDTSDNVCKSFVYGGCEGNDNRFEQRVDCETRCVKKTVKVTESPLPTSPPAKEIPVLRESNEDVCRLPVDPGPCNSALQRWFYDAQTQSCLPFVFSGCGGNKNRFKTSEMCLRFCTGIKPTSTQESSFVLTTVPTEETTECPASNCADIQCSYGIEQSFDPNGCTTCRCSNPCEDLDCPEGSRCAIDVVRTSREGIRTEPLCRRVNKPGQCPSENPYGATDCETRCRDDADCRGEHKCCSNGCAFQCVPPAEDPLITPTKPEPALIRPGLNRTQGRVGEPAELPCDATGWPRPTVTWWRETTMLPLSSSRYETLASHALLIRSVVRADAGDYQCHAHNGVGTGAVYVVSLVIDLTPGGRPEEEPDREAEPDFGPALRTQVSLVTQTPRVGAPVQVDCVVEGGAASVRISWSRSGEPLREDDRIRVLSNHTLLIAKAVREDQGEYRCTAEQAGAISQAALFVELQDSEDSDCEDNPQFNSCGLVVKANYCSNASYRKFCCRSCSEAEARSAEQNK